MRAKVYGIPGSSPVKTGLLMLAHKGIEASRTDLPAAIEGRPAGQLAREVAPDYPGHVRSTLPAEWLAPLLARAG